MHERILNVHPLPRLVSQDALAGGAVIVVDLLRATTTICQALASGAREVVPFLEVEEAVAALAGVDRDEIVLGGERGGKRIDGFDLGNSPAEYTPEVVAGRHVFITTTNGTRALGHARLARRVLCGAIVNRSAVVESVRNELRVEILCAGTDGQLTREDILAAGAVVDQLYGTAEPPADSSEWRTNESARAAYRDWQCVLAAARESGRTVSEQLAVELHSTPGGRNLLDIGLDGDLADCAAVDRLDVVPELDVRAWRITLA